MNRIALVGFMGAGKTTVGRELAQILGWRFRDTDQELERQTHAAASQLLQEDPAGFRRLESAVIAQLLQEEEIVLATGGGAAAREENLELLLAQAFVVYLEAPVELLWSRCGGQRGESLRPLMREGFAHFRALFQGREASYRSAHLVVDGTGEPEEIARRIIAGWRNGGWT